MIQKRLPQKQAACNVDYAANLDAQLMQNQLRSAIARLPEYLRDVVILRELAELTYAEVARMLGITAATARVYRFKAVTLLSAWMAKDKK